MLEPSTIVSIAKALGISATQVFSTLKRAHARVSEADAKEAAAAFFQAGARIAEEGLAHQVLGRYYPVEEQIALGFAPYAYQVGNQNLVTTVATRNEWISRVPLASDFEKCRLTVCSSPPMQIAEERIAKLLVSLSLRNIRVWDAPLYRLIDLDIRDRTLSANFSLESFYRYRVTNGALIDELVQALLDTDFNPNAVLEARERYLPLRQHLLPDMRSVAEFRSRLCTGGVNVVTAIARPQPFCDYAIVLQRRSASVSSRQGGLTVLPAGQHQPTVEPESEVGISCTVFREVFEELFGGHELESGSMHLVYDWFCHESPPLKWLMNHKGAYDLLMTGFGLSMMSGGYTFSVLLAIHDQSFWTQFRHLLRTNWEVSDVHQPIFSTRSRSLDLLLHPEWTDYGIFSLVEGILELQRIKPNMVALPSLQRSLS
jgi:hypothetical protein